jgi:hypothetical protein
MLGVVLQSGLKLGVNWYLYANEGHNKDGRHTAYLKRDRHKVETCDPELYLFLKLRWETTAKRFFFWLMKTEHIRQMMACIYNLTSGDWGKHFYLIALY